MKAIWNETVLAEADKDELIKIEGNWYFPPHSVNKEVLQTSDTRTTCFWKGEASYYNVFANGQQNADAAFFYHQPMPGSLDRTKRDFKDYVSFWHGVQIVE